MKKFLAGLFVGLLVSGLALLAQQQAGEKVVQPQVLAVNEKVNMDRWVLQPGESTPVHTHTLDHIGVIIRGSTMRLVDSGGKVTKDVAMTGEARFIRGTGVTHSFANVGKTTLEIVSIELR